MASRAFLVSTEFKMLRDAKLIMVSPVAAKLASTRLGSTPPRNCKNPRIGKPVRTSSDRLHSREINLLSTISRLRRSVAKTNSSVRRSFSSAIDPAV